MTVRSKITAKGQTTIPAEIRDALGLKPGDMVTYSIEGDTVRIDKTRSIMDLAGILHRPGMKALAIEEMDEAVMDAVLEDDERIKREWSEGRG